MIRIEGVPMVAERLEASQATTVEDLTTKEHEAFARLDAWLASPLTNRQVPALAGAGRTHL
jgi:hypothetical protein